MTKTTAAAALATLLLAAPALAGAPAAPAAAPAAGAEPAKPESKKVDTKATTGKDASKPAPSSGDAEKKEAPCEPVKPCPIE